MKTIQVVQMSTRQTHSIKDPFETRLSFLKRHEGTIIEILFGAYIAYLFIQYFTN